MLEGQLWSLHENTKPQDVICQGWTSSQQFPASSHIVNLQILIKQKNKTVLKASLFIGPTVEWREKEKPLSRHGSPATGLQSSETLYTRDLFFSHRSTSCGLLQEWKLHSTTITIQDKVSSLLTRDMLIWLKRQKKNTYNRYLVTELRAPVKVNLTLSKLGRRPQCLWYLYEHLWPPLFIQLNFKEEVVLLCLGQALKLPYGSAWRNACPLEVLPDGLISRNN